MWPKEWAAEKWGVGQEGMEWRVSRSQRVGCVAHTRRGGALTHTHTSDGMRAVASDKPFIKLNYLT